MQQATLIPINLKDMNHNRTTALERSVINYRWPPSPICVLRRVLLFVCVVCSTDREGQYDSYLNGGIMALFCCVMPIVFRHI